MTYIVSSGTLNPTIPYHTIAYSTDFTSTSIQGDHLSGKPGNVREFDSCQGNVRDFTKIRGNVMEKLPKTVYCKLHICIHTGI